MTFRQFLLFLSAQEIGIFANSTDGNVQLLRLKGPGLNLVDCNDPATMAALQVFLTPARIMQMQGQSAPLFSLTQLLALLTAAELSAIVGSADAKIKAFLFQNVNNSFTMAGITPQLNYLVAQGLLTSARETVILSSPTPTPPSL